MKKNKGIKILARNRKEATKLYKTTTTDKDNSKLNNKSKDL